MATAACALWPSGDHVAPVMMPRPQIGIGRLPVKRSSGEHKEAMNCKSCRKRKIKCNRLKPSCEACQVFNCACVYDAIPKKRGPKTDVLEALLQRVNGLEKRLQEEKDSDSPEAAEAAEVATTVRAIKEKKSQRAEASDENHETAVESPQDPEPVPAPLHTRQPQQQMQLLPAQPITQPHESHAFRHALIDTYFARLHGKPYYILDEQATRQRLRDDQLPRFLLNAVYASTVRYIFHMCGGHHAAVRYSQEYALQARAEIDVDEPSIEHLQTLLLLAIASFQSGRGKKTCMLLSHAVSMAFALGLHRELPPTLRIASSEREGRRKLFWTCYLMDRFNVSGSKRPSLISDESIYLRLPAWLPQGSHLWMDGAFFPNGSSLPHAAGVANAGQGSGAMLVEVARILGATNRYLATGGVKGDSHFPWHAQSTLSQIRSDLDYWAANTQDAFTSLESLFGQPDSPVLVLSKLIYHLINCLIYRPFLPIDLAELTGSSQHQSWQIEATNLCFLHANAVAELVEIGKNAIIDWPSFVSYCICTAGTIHVHGAHYLSTRDDDVFNRSTRFLTREMAQLYDLRFIWAGVERHREVLRAVYASHSQLVKSLANNQMHFSPVLQMEDFFDRYPGSYIDGAHVTFTDVDLELLQQESLTSTFNGIGGNGSLDSWMSQPTSSVNAGPEQQVGSSHYMTQNQMPAIIRGAKRRRTTNGSVQYPTPSSQSASANPEPERQMPRNNSDPQQQQQLLPISQQPQTDSNSSMDDQHASSHLQLPQDQMFTQSALSPSFNFSPLHQPHPAQLSDMGQHDLFRSVPRLDHQTPSGFSQSADSVHTEPMDKDPFLSFLEQLAQNDGSEGAGPSDLDFFLNEQG